MQASDHGQRQRALVVQHLVDAVAASDEGFQILDGQAALFHAELDRLHRTGFRSHSVVNGRTTMFAFGAIELHENEGPICEIYSSATLN